MPSYEGTFKFFFVPTAAIVIVLGITLCGLGIAKVVQYNNDIDSALEEDDDELKDEVYVHIPAAIVASGGILAIVVIALGCCAGFKENRLLLIVYIVLISVILLLASICAIVLFAAKSEKFREKLIEKQQYFNEEKDAADKEEKATKIWNNVQKTFHCCGVESYTEWANNTYLISQGVKVPESCCDYGTLKDNSDKCQSTPADFADELKPCTGMTNPFGNSVAVVALIMAIVMGFNLVASCMMCFMVE